MRKKTMVVLAVLTFAGWVGQAEAATEVQRVTFVGSQAAFEFSASTSITCANGSPGVASAFGFVSGSDSISNSTGSPQTISNGAFVEIDSYFNSCTGVFFFADGGIANSYTPPDKKLDSASIVGSGTVQDFNSGNNVPLSLNVSFVGTGSTSQSKSNSHSKTTGTTHGNLSISHSQSANSNRAATVTGTISIDNVTFNSFDVFFADLVANSSASLSVSK